MNTPALVALNPPAWLPLDLLFPAGIGVGTGFLIVLTFHFLVRGRGTPQDTQDPADPSRDFDPFVQGSSSEQRSIHRRTGNTVEILIRTPGLQTEPERGWVVDRSMNGLGLGGDREYPGGTILEIRPANAPPITPWVEVEVLNVRRTDVRWHLGCRFVRIPPWAMLMMFG